MSVAPPLVVFASLSCVDLAKPQQLFPLQTTFHGLAMQGLGRVSNNMADTWQGHDS